jgi:hypothetical protein
MQQNTKSPGSKARKNLTKKKLYYIGRLRRQKEN